jgi:hypothetical protein
MNQVAFLPWIKKEKKLLTRKSQFGNYHISPQIEALVILSHKNGLRKEMILNARYR